MLVWNTEEVSHSIIIKWALVSWNPFFSKHSQTMEQISAEINKLNTKIDDIEVLLKKTFKDWSEEENNLYGIEEQEARKQLRRKEEQLREERKQLREERKQLREERKQLRRKEEQLREQQIILLRNKEMTNAGGILGIKVLS
jgi:predicted  nucleic acid-binding Zn-ribbon protein